MPRRIPRFCLRARVSKGLVTYVISTVPDSLPLARGRSRLLLSFPTLSRVTRGGFARATRYRTDIPLACTDDSEAEAEAGNDGDELGSGSDPRSRPGFWRKSLTNIHQLISGR